MTVAIDISATGNLHENRGTGVYTSCLKEALQKYESSISYIFFTRGQKLPRNVDLIHYPYFDPFFLTMPLFKEKPTVVTVHDLIPIAFPEHFPRGIRGSLKWYLQKVSLRWSRHIITDSESSKNTIHSLIGYPRENISVVYLAPRELFSDPVTGERKSSIRKKYGLRTDFILYVGDVNWNKNILGLLEAFKLARNQKKDLRLLLVGKTFQNTHIPEVRAIWTKVTDLKIDTSVVKLGYIPDDELHAVYALAGGYVQPSFAEGFGLPVVEAMASGCPCVVSDNSSLSEIAGPSIRVDADNPESISAGILDLFSEKGRSARERSREWVKQYSWRRVAGQTIDAYKKALSI